MQVAPIPQIKFSNLSDYVMNKSTVQMQHFSKNLFDGNSNKISKWPSINGRLFNKQKFTKPQ